MAVRSGDPCPMCGSKLICRTSRRKAENWQEQTLVCKNDACDYLVRVLVRAVVELRRVIRPST